jgi:hypothetical protein
MPQFEEEEKQDAETAGEQDVESLEALGEFEESEEPAEEEID